MNLKEYQALKDEADSLRRQADRASGALGQLLSELKEEWQCNNLQQAEVLLANMQLELEQEEAQAQEALEAYRAQWEGKL